MEMSISSVKDSVMKAAHKVEAKAKANPKATLAIGAGAVVVSLIALAAGSPLLAIVAAVVAVAVAVIAKNNPEVFKDALESIKISVKHFCYEQKRRFSAQTEEKGAVADETRVANKAIQPKEAKRWRWQ